MRLLGLGPQSTSSCREVPAARLAVEASTTFGPAGRAHSFSRLWQTCMCLQQCKAPFLCSEAFGCDGGVLSLAFPLYLPTLCTYSRNQPWAFYRVPDEVKRGHILFSIQYFLSCSARPEFKRIAPGLIEGFADVLVHPLQLALSKLQS